MEDNKVKMHTVLIFTTYALYLVIITKYCGATYGTRVAHTAVHPVFSEYMVIPRS